MVCPIFLLQSNSRNLQDLVLLLVSSVFFLFLVLDAFWLENAYQLLVSMASGGINLGQVILYSVRYALIHLTATLFLPCFTTTYTFILKLDVDVSQGWKRLNLNYCCNSVCLAPSSNPEFDPMGIPWFWLEDVL